MKKSKNVNENQRYAVGYCRYSSENQSETSIEAQQKEIMKYVEQNNLIFLRWYVDRAQSGTNDNRKEFKQMMDDSKKQEFSKVLVYQMDRFARNKEDSVINKFELRKSGVKVVSITERFGDSVEGQVMEGMLEIFADYFSKDLSRKTLRGMKLNIEKGFNNGGTTPYGYKLTPRLDENGKPMFHKKGHALHNIIIDQEKAEAVKLMFQMTIDGYTRSDIITNLTKLGFKKNNGNVFTGTYIDNILRNERYTGEFWYYFDKGKVNFDPNSDEFRIRITKGFEPIIFKQDYDTVQKLLATRKHRPPTNAEENYLLTGNVVCGECGSNYNGMRCKRNGKLYTYYQCTDQHSYSNGQAKEKYCHNNTIRKDDIENLVIEKIKQVVFNENLITQVLEEYNKFAKQESLNNSMVMALENKIKDIDTQINAIINAISHSNGNPVETLLERLQELERNKNTAKQTLASETVGADLITATENDIKKIYLKAQSILDGSDISAKRVIINNFLNKVVVNKNKVEVYLNLVPMTCCANLGLEILNTHLFMGDLSEGDWDFAEYPDYPITNLKQYRQYKEKPGTRFIPSFTGLNLFGSAGSNPVSSASTNENAF